MATASLDKHPDHDSEKARELWHQPSPHNGELSGGAANAPPKTLLSDSLSTPHRRLGADHSNSLLSGSPYVSRNPLVRRQQTPAVSSRWMLPTLAKPKSPFLRGRFSPPFAPACPAQEAIEAGDLVR